MRRSFFLFVVVAAVTLLSSAPSEAQLAWMDPPGVSVLANGDVEICNETTPDCWIPAVTEVPVELMSITVD